jgi:hypothetical protein
VFTTSIWSFPAAMGNCLTLIGGNLNKFKTSIKKVRASNMKKTLLKKSEIQKLITGAAVVVTVIFGAICFADNPIIQTKYTADPAPMVYNDTVYLYTSHDEDDAHGFKMFNWLLYSSTDMVNWTDHGTLIRRSSGPMAIVHGLPSVSPETASFIYIAPQYSKGRWQSVSRYRTAPLDRLRILSENR